MGLVFTAVILFAAPPMSKAEGPGPDDRKDKEGFPLPADAVARVGSARLRHGLMANLTYSPDGKILASSGGGLVRLWDTSRGKLLRSITVAEGGPGDAHRILDGPFSTDGKTVLAIDDETCRWFNVGTGKEVRRCKITFPKVNAGACFAPHGEMVAVVGIRPGEDFVVYDLPSGKERFRKTARRAWGWESTFSSDGKMLAVLEREDRPASRHYRVHFFDTAAGKLLGEFDVGEPYYRGLAFAPDGTKLLGLHSQEKKENIHVWSVPAGKLLHQVEIPVQRLIMAAFSPDGKSVLVSNIGLDALLIDLATGKNLQRFRNSISVSVAFAPGGRSVAVGQNDGTISQWEVATGKRLDASADPICTFGPPLRFDKDGKHLWVPSDTFALIDWRSGREVKRVRVPHELYSWFLSLSPDGSRVAGVNAAMKPAVWDAASGKELCVLPIAGSGRYRTFSPDGKTLYTGELQGPVRAWDVSTGRERPAFDQRDRIPGSVVISPNGRWLATADIPRTGARREITVWDLQTGREAHSLLPLAESDRAWGLAFSPDSTFLAVVGSAPFNRGEGPKGLVMVWDLRTGKERAFGSGPTAKVRSVAFSADGRMLATGSSDGAVRLWEFATGQERYRFTGHTGVVQSVAFSPDGVVVAAASDDAPVFVWDVTGCYGRRPLTTAFSRAEEDQLWKSLADRDAARAFQAMRQLLARPGPATALVASRLKPAAAIEARLIELQLAALDADDFTAREKARAELAKADEQAEPLLRKALGKEPALEVKRQIEALLDGIETPSMEPLRAMRVVEMLEHIATADARKLLDEFVAGAKNARLTREAKAAKGRMKQP